MLTGRKDASGSAHVDASRYVKASLAVVPPAWQLTDTLCSCTLILSSACNKVGRIVSSHHGAALSAPLAATSAYSERRLSSLNPQPFEHIEYIPAFWQSGYTLRDVLSKPLHMIIANWQCLRSLVPSLPVLPRCTACGCRLTRCVRPE